MEYPQLPTGVIFSISGDNKLQHRVIVYNNIISVYVYESDRLTMYVVNIKSIDLNDVDIFIHEKNYLSIYPDIYFPLKFGRYFLRSNVCKTANYINSNETRTCVIIDV